MSEHEEQTCTPNEASGQGLLTEHPCQYCDKNDTCDTICPLRAKWWDAQMEKIRKRINE